MGLSWLDIGERLGLPDELAPLPFPLLPIPKGLVMKVEGLGRYRAWALRDSTIEELGYVYGGTKEEAEDAAENAAEVTGGPFSAIGVIRE